MRGLDELPRDGKRWLTILGFALLGLTLVGWGVRSSGDRQLDLVAAGLIFEGFAAVSLVDRLRHGPQPRGRHSRDSFPD